MADTLTVGLLAPLFNPVEQEALKSLQAKIKAIGYQVEIAQDALERYQVLVVVFDGRALTPADYIKIGLFTGQSKQTDWPRLLVGYLTAPVDYLGPEKKYLQHLATTELNLISCLKDYIYFHQRS